MIAREHRFHGFNSLRHVYGRGQTVRTNWLAVKFQPNPRRSSYRAAVVVSRKVHKSAVVRNRIRRRIYEIIRLHETFMTGSYDIVLTVFSDHVATMDATALQADIVRQLAKAGVIRTQSSSQGMAQHDIVSGREVKKVREPEERP